nr:metallophosphoesterase [Candidatus Sigynarchaeota archaeon]
MAVAKVRSKTVMVLGIIILAAIPLFITAHAILAEGRIRIVDPMIGCAQFCKPDESMLITVEYSGFALPSSWHVGLHHVDFEWRDETMLAVNSVNGLVQGTYVLNTTIPIDALPGLYDLEISCKSFNVNLSASEPHSVYVYNSTPSLRFAHFADPHICYPDQNITLNLAPPYATEILGNRTIADNLRDLLADVSIARPEFIVITGDIATRGLEQEFQATRQVLLSSKVPVLCTIGNHDHRSPPSFEYYLAPVYYSRVIDAWRIVILDTGATEGNGLFGEQLRWFEQELVKAEVANQQVIVAMHIPSAPEATGGYTIAGNAEFRALCAQYGVRAVFAGHHHYYDANYANGSQVLRPDPIPASVGTLYVKSGSTTLDYGNGAKGLGWRYVRSDKNGSISIGYDAEGTNSSDPLWGLPLNGLKREDGNLQLNLTNYYRMNFTNITIPVSFPLSSPDNELVPSEGTIIAHFKDATTAGLLLRVTLPASSTKIITFMEM